jgi:hypothetical protein
MVFVGVCTFTDIACLILLLFSTDDETGTAGRNSGEFSVRNSLELWKNRCAVTGGCLLLRGVQLAKSV